MKTPRNLLSRGLRLVHDRDNPITLAPHELRGIVVAGAIVANLNSNVTSTEALRRWYAYRNPKASDDELALLVAADQLLGHPDELTIEQARLVVANPPLVPRALPFRRRIDPQSSPG